MKTNFERVEEFMTTFGQNVLKQPTLADNDTKLLRLSLIEEELQELRAALGDKDIVEVADALTDLLYVIYGMGHTYGINLDACFVEVHASNMSKLDSDGNPIYRVDGKVLKGDDYFAPDLRTVIYEGKEK